MPCFKEENKYNQTPPPKEPVTGSFLRMRWQRKWEDIRPPTCYNPISQFFLLFHWINHISARVYPISHPSEIIPLFSGFFPGNNTLNHSFHPRNIFLEE